MISTLTTQIDFFFVCCGDKGWGWGLIKNYNFKNQNIKERAFRNPLSGIQKEQTDI